MSFIQSDRRIEQLRAQISKENAAKELKMRGRLPGTPKTGGRKKGTPNKCRKSIDYFAEQVFKKTDMVQKGMELLEHKDPRVQAMVWCRLMDYKFGRPREQLVISGSVDMRSVVAQARQRVMGISRPPMSLPGNDLEQTPLIAADEQIMENARTNDGREVADSIELSER